jgi:hypothetical protein
MVAALTVALAAMPALDARASNLQEMLAEDASTYETNRAIVCAIAITAMHLPQDASTAPRSISLTLGISSELGGVVKGFAEEILPDGLGGETVRRRVPIDEAWAGIPGNAYTRPLANISLKERNKILYLTDAGFSIALLRGILEDQDVEVGVRLKSEPGERVVAGRPAMSVIERVKFSGCMGDLLRAANQR